MVGLQYAKQRKKVRGQVVILLLAGVHELLSMLTTQHMTNGNRFDEFGDARAQFTAFRARRGYEGREPGGVSKRHVLSMIADCTLQTLRHAHRRPGYAAAGYTYPYRPLRTREIDFVMTAASCRGVTSRSRNRIGTNNDKSTSLIAMAIQMFFASI